MLTKLWILTLIPDQYFLEYLNHVNKIWNKSINNQTWLTRALIPANIEKHNAINDVISILNSQLLSKQMQRIKYILSDFA